jgi:nucleoside-diphosphate-sugar epimerase
VKRFLVTGATGYLGPWLAREIVARFGPDSLTCLIPSVLPPIEHKSLAYLRRLGAVCLECNLMKSPVLEGELPAVDVLIHMAANTRTDLPLQALTVNTVGTTNLLNTFGQSLAGKRVILTSTSAAIDRNAFPTAPLTENSPAHPRTGYGVSKLQAERIVQQAANDFKFDYTITRLTTLYGPGMRGGLFYVLADWAGRGHTLARINWPGKASFIFVEDAARILLWLSTADEARNQVFFVSSGETASVGDLARSIVEWHRGSARQISIPAWFWTVAQRIIWLPAIKGIVPWRLANVIDDSLLCDSSRLRAIYPGAITSLKDGLNRTCGPDAMEDELARALA